MAQKVQCEVLVSRLMMDNPDGEGDVLFRKGDVITISAEKAKALGTSVRIFTVPAQPTKQAKIAERETVPPEGETDGAPEDKVTARPSRGKGRK